MKLAKVSTSHIRAVTGTTFACMLSSLLFGYCTAVISGVVGAIEYNFHPAARRQPDGGERSAERCSLRRARWHHPRSVGGATRRRIVWPQTPMMLASILFLVSAIGSAFPEMGLTPIGGMGADAIWPFIAYRIFGGVAVGLASVVAPLYVAELAPSAVRGQLGAYQQIAIAVGIALVLFVNWASVCRVATRGCSRPVGAT
jgi:SP family xylose:H+ symportor-like MFS transporter